MTDEGEVIKSTPNPNSSNSFLDDSSIKKVLEEKQKKVDMGPRWSEEELDIFLKHFRLSNLKELEIMQAKLAEAGYKRSVNNLIAVYLKNRNFLTSNTGCTAKDLSAIMADHYDAMESEYQMISEKPSLKLDIENDSITEKKRVSTPYGLNSRAYYTDPRTRGLDEQYIKRKNSKAKKGQSATTDDVYDSLMLKRHTSSEIITRERPKKPRKTPVHSGKFLTDLPFSNENLFKELEPNFRTCTGKANRKSNNFSLRRQSDDKVYSIPFLYFLDCELFYSSIDKPYFSFNEMRFILGNAAEGKKFKRAEWSFLRSCMGKPRRFSNAFVKSQMDDLNNYRNSVRNFLYNKGSLPESKLQPSVIQKVKELQPFQVSQTVLAIHPHCNHIHPGSILTITGSNIIVKFFPSELGAQRVPDSKVLAISQEEAAQISEYFSGSRFRLTGIPMNRSNSDFDEKNPSQNKILQDMDYNALSLYIKILEKKTTLVNELRHFNDTAEGNPSSLNEKFYQEYGWTGVQIKVLDNALKHITTKTRLRGLGNFSDPEQLANNLDSLMTNPLRNLLELDEKKGEDIDPQVVNEIRTLLNKNIEQKIDDQIKSYSVKAASNHQGLLNVLGGRKDDKELETIKEEKILSPRSQAFKDKIIDDVDEKHKSSLANMVNNVMGVMLSLKYNNGEMNISDNKYLNDIHREIYEENSEIFHEINRNLLNINIK